MTLFVLAGIALQATAWANPRTIPARKPSVLKPGQAVRLPGQDKYARELLRQMLQAEQQVALSGDQVTFLIRNGQPVTSEQQVLRNGTHAYRMEYVQPANLAGELIIDNGSTFWHYSPSTKRLEQGASRINRLRSRVPQVMAQIKQGSLAAQYLGQDTVAGRTCSVVEVTSRDTTQAPQRRFWIDPTNGAQLRIDEYDANGQVLSSSYYNTVSYNPQIGPDAFRAPSVPQAIRQSAPAAAAGATPLTLPQAQALAGFTIQQPTYVPHGFRFQSASVSDFRRKKLVSLRYVNGLNVLSLFETSVGPRVAAQPALVTRPRPGVLNLVQNGLRFILVGNLSPDEMEKVIISVH